MARRGRIPKGGQTRVPVADDAVESTFGIFAEEFAELPPPEDMIRELREQDVAAGARPARPDGSGGLAWQPGGPVGADN